MGDFLASVFTVSAFALALGELVADMGLPGPARLWAALAILVLSLPQWSGLRWGALLQDLTSLGKGVMLLALGLGALLLPGAPPGPRPPASGGGLLAFAGAMQLVVFAYDNYYVGLLRRGVHRPAPADPALPGQRRAPGDGAVPDPRLGHGARAALRHPGGLGPARARLLAARAGPSR